MCCWRTGMCTFARRARRRRRDVGAVVTKRYLEKFTSADGSTIVYTFPLARYEYVSTQALRSPRLTISGAEYGFRLRGDAPSLKEVAVERVRAVFTGTASEQDAELDEARGDLYLGAYGKLWTLGDDSSRRWAWAELSEMPEFTVRAGENLLVGGAFGFNRFSNWFGETALSDTETVTVDGTEYVVAYAGTLPGTRVTIRLRSNSSAGFTNPRVTNVTNGFEFETQRDAASADDEVKLDTSRPSVEYSDDDGATYSDDFGNYVLPPSTQRPLSFRLEPGNNTIKVESGGTPNLDVVITAEVEYP